MLDINKKWLVPSPTLLRPLSDRLECTLGNDSVRQDEGCSLGALSLELLYLLQMDFLAAQLSTLGHTNRIWEKCLVL